MDSDGYFREGDKKVSGLELMKHDTSPNPKALWNEIYKGKRKDTIKEEEKNPAGYVEFDKPCEFRSTYWIDLGDWLEMPDDIRNKFLGLEPQQDRYPAMKPFEENEDRKKKMVVLFFKWLGVFAIRGSNNPRRVVLGSRKHFDTATNMPVDQIVKNCVAGAEEEAILRMTFKKFAKGLESATRNMAWAIGSGGWENPVQRWVGDVVDDVEVYEFDPFSSTGAKCKNYGPSKSAGPYYKGEATDPGDNWC